MNRSHGSDSSIVPVWDLPLRLFHWLLVGSLAAAWWSAQTNDFEFHLRVGGAILGLLVFRLYWGFVGSSTARFSQFLRRPAAVREYARTLFSRENVHPFTGHNPLGGWSVMLMLLCVASQTVLGLFAVDVDGINSGPLSDRVSFDTGRAIARLHHWNFNLLIGLIALHIAAIVFYQLYKTQNLIRPMLLDVSSTRVFGEQQSSSTIWWRALPGVALGLAVTVWVSTSGGMP